MIRKPVRHVAQNTRSRGEKAVDKRKDAQRAASPRLHDFAAKVGLRRRAYLHHLAAVFREQLIHELEAHFEANRRKPDHDLIDEKYCLRGLNRKLALDHNLPAAYNRLALMAVRMFHLSHWRLDVTGCNDLLAA